MRGSVPRAWCESSCQLPLAMDFDRGVPLEWIVSQRFGVFGCGRLEHRPIAHNGAAERFSQALRPGGDVHRIVGGGVFLALRRAGMADPCLASVEGDFDAGRRHFPLLQFAIQVCHPLPARRRRRSGQPGVTVGSCSARAAKKDQDAITHDFVPGAALGVELRHHGLEIPVEHIGEGVGGGPKFQRAGVGQAGSTTPSRRSVGADVNPSPEAATHRRRGPAGPPAGSPRPGPGVGSDCPAGCFEAGPRPTRGWSRA